MAVHGPTPVPRLSGDIAHGDADWLPPPAIAARGASPQRVNPYHFIHHPDSDEVLPPLPPHLARLASGEAATDDEGSSDTSDSEIDSGSDDDDDDFGNFPTPVAAMRSRLGSPSTVQAEGSATAAKQGSAEAAVADAAAAAAATTPPAPQRIMQKVSNVFRRGDSAKDKASLMLGTTPERQRSPMMQGPPPSPPLSDASDNEDAASSIAVTEETATDDAAHRPRDVQTPEPRPSMSSQLLMPVTEAGESTHTLGLEEQPPSFAMSLTSEPERARASSPAGEGRASSRDRDFERPPQPPFLGISAPRRVSSSSTSSRAGSLSMVRSGRLAPQRDYPGSPDTQRTLEIQDDPRGRLSTDGASFDMSRFPMPLPPPLDMSFQNNNSANSSPASTGSVAPRLTRRNTNPTSPIQSLPTGGSRLTHSVSISANTPTSAGYDNFNLPADILAQTEILRRERLERRQKKMSLMVSTSPSQAEPSVPETTVQRKVTVRRKETDETKVLVGNLVGEGHRNYVLMYNMLTGIRVAVSRCQAKIKRPITDEDYLARHKYSFDMLGNELTPSARYDFKFKDYAPWVFRELRDEHFHLDPADYLLSLTAKYILSELGSPGKSGSFFYYSRDYRFIIKTISHSEHAFLRSILKDYHEHVRSNPHTLLSRFYGLHRVKIPRGRKIHFVIMNNLFPPHRDIHETYDLKGSAFGREYPEDKAANNPRAVLKDKNWVNRGRTLELGPEKRALLTEQLRRDMEFLKRVHVMDYSLLIGIHNMERGNRDNLRANTLAVFHPNTEPVRRKPSAVKSHGEAHNVRKAVVRADPKRLDTVAQLPQDGSDDRRHFLFYQDEGGLRATDEQNNPLDAIYYLGVIDICTPYNTSKRIEHAWKSMTENAVTISCVDPVTYGHRFIDFLMSVMRGGDPNIRPPGLETPAKLTDPHAQPAVGCELDKNPVQGRPSFQQSVCCSTRPLSTPPLIVEMTEVSTEPVTTTTTPVQGRQQQHSLQPAFDEKSQYQQHPQQQQRMATDPVIEEPEDGDDVPTAMTEEQAADAHDLGCDECVDHERPATVGHLKAE